MHKSQTASLYISINQSINQSIYIAPKYRGVCYSAVMPNQREMS